MSGQLTIDPKKQDDPHYRYKMPKIVVKIEGNGNGIKSVFPNIHDVCAKLGRPAEILNKFFGYELGAQSTYIKADDKFLVMGSFSYERIQEKTFDFINRFVLCKSCRNPETHPFMKKSKMFMHCGACGYDTEINQSERILSVMKMWVEAEAKKSAAEAKKAGKKAGDKAAADKDGAAAAKDGEAGDASGAAAAPEDIAAAKASAAKPIPDAKKKIETNAADIKRANPIETLSNLLRQTPPPSAEQAIHAVFELKTEYSFSDAHLGRLLVRGILHGVEGDKFIGAMQNWLGLLSPFAAGKPEMALILIKELSIACHGYKNPGKFPMALKMLWEEGIVSEHDIIEWHAKYKPSGKEIPKEFVQELKTATTVLVDWLKAE